MLLAGIKTGKKKKKKSSNNSTATASSSSPASVSATGGVAAVPASGSVASRQEPKQQGDGVGTVAAASKPASEATTLSSENESLAEQLRQSFRQGKALPVGFTSKKQKASLEDRGRILLEGKPHARASLKRGDDDDDDPNVVVMKYGASSQNNNKKSDQDLTIADMVAQERLLGNDATGEGVTQNEEAAREVMRMNKRRKIKKNVDSDEEEERQLQSVGIMSEAKAAKAAAAAKAPTARQERQQQRQEHAQVQRAVARHDAQENIIAKCWWWVEAKKTFQRHRLLALGNFVSLVMAPPALSVVPGQHFYIVPIRHAPSLLACDTEVWQEVQHFQSSLRAMYATPEKSKAVIFTETVLSTSSFWQTRMEAMVVPNEVALDAPLCFKKSMMEQAEEWGTHSHKIYNISHQKSLVQTLPSKASNLAYFYIDFGGGGGSGSGNNTTSTNDSTTTGYAQVIESSQFPKDFAADTVAGMMQLDPIRLRRRRQPRGDANEAEQRLVRTFLQGWKDFDWTLQLDDGA